MGWDFVNSIPIVGHVKAAVEAVTGDTDAAVKTFAAATGGLLSTAGAVGGFVVGGPAGAVAGGSLGSMIGGQLELKINGQDLDLSVQKLATDAATGGVGGILGGGGVGNAAKGVVQGVGKVLPQILEKELVNIIIESGAGSISKVVVAQVGQQLYNGTINSSKDEKGGSTPSTDPRDPNAAVLMTIPNGGKTGAWPSFKG